MTRRSIGLALLLGLGFAGADGPGAAAETVLRVTPHANPQVLDPHTNTATITVMHAHLIYDTLFAYDEELSPKPQMVERYKNVVSARKGAVHRLENIGAEPLHLIEVQSGSYLGEDDIVRLADSYGRV